MSVEPQLDNDILSTLRDVMGDDFPLLLDTFVRDSRERLQSLGACVQAGDSDGLRRGAHSFKGSSSNIGAVRLAEACRVMEQMALTGDPSPWAAQLQRIEHEFDDACRGLESIRS